MSKSTDQSDEKLFGSNPTNKSSSKNSLLNSSIRSVPLAPSPSTTISNPSSERLIPMVQAEQSMFEME